MIHELLFNLWNNPGNFIDTEDSDWTHFFELPQFLHPSEEKLLQLIIKIGLDYHKITSFTNKVLSQDCMAQVETECEQLSSKLPNGLYLKAFSHGIRQSLEDYKKEILKLEDMFLEYPHLPLIYVLSSIEKYQGLFGVLKLLIHKIQTENLYGCLLMSSLHKYIDCGIDQIEQAANIIIKSVNTVFYQHLCNWIVCGNIMDPYKEFFICDGKVPDENFLYPEQLTENVCSYTVKKTKIRRPPPIRKFFINWEMVPKFLSEEYVESILFMGRIVWIIKHDPKKEICNENYQTKFRRNIWGGKDTEYYAKIENLGKQNFNNSEFRKTLEECRIELTKYLWSIMLEESNLIQHLKLIRDHYGLGRGELFQQFLTTSSTHLKDVASDSALQHINFIFHETARKIYGENDKTYLKFELTSPNSDISKKNFWQRLQLNFEIEWPLHIVFHPEVMELYNKLFCYLVRLKKTQINLHKLWSKHTLRKPQIDRRVWMLRQNLMFLVNNLQYFMQVNVIEAEFSILLKAVESASEFEDVIKIHHDFVTNLLVKTFLLIPDESLKGRSKHRLYQLPALQHNVPSKVYNVVTKLLELCDEFYIVASTWETDLTEGDIIELDAFQKRFDIAIESLIFILHNLHEKVNGGHILHLLLLLDFNRYYSKNKADLNITKALNLY